VSHKQVIILRKDLNMRKGKMVAQGAHASLGAMLSVGTYDEKQLVIPLDERLKPWLAGVFKKICVSATSEQELLHLHQKAKDSGLLCALIQDAGLTEFGGVPTYTALAIGPDLESKVDLITGHLPLL
jgi:peptidyl-tRNA hydrolase, PTH2 family